jgi:hypothetical protein
MFKAPEPIDEKKRDEMIDAMAKRVQQFGMLVPAIFFLEMNKPLSYIGAQAMHFFSPIAGVLFPTFEDYAYFLEDRGNVELLIQKLERLSEQEEEERRQAKKEKKLQKQAKRSSMLDEAMQLEKEKSGDLNVPKDSPPQ